MGPIFNVSLITLSFFIFHLASFILLPVLSPSLHNYFWSMCIKTHKRARNRKDAATLWPWSNSKHKAFYKHYDYLSRSNQPKFESEQESQSGSSAFLFHISAISNGTNFRMKNGKWIQCLRKYNLVEMLFCHSQSQS